MRYTMVSWGIDGSIDDSNWDSRPVLALSECSHTFFSLGRRRSLSWVWYLLLRATAMILQINSMVKRAGRAGMIPSALGTSMVERITGSSNAHRL